MCYSPGYSKPTHGYGIPLPFPAGALPENDPETDAEMAVLFEGPADEDWAGKGFEKPYE